jgi:hypothetical protein
MKEDKTLAAIGHHAHKYTEPEKTVLSDLCAAFEQSALPLAQRLQTFPRHVRRQDIARFLVKYEIFKIALPVNGCIVECGVFAGGGLMAWTHFSSILEPYNHTRTVVGFDTFSGFPGISEHDSKTGQSNHLYPGAFRTTESIMDEIATLAGIHDRNRPLGHIPKVQLVDGDACKTIPEFISTHPHLLVSLLYLDFDIYEPTRAALEHIYPRVVRGGVVAFDELNCAEFPGETIALLEKFDMKEVELRRFPYDPYISYFVKQ